MKKIAFVCPWYGDHIPGGAEAALRGVSEHLFQAGLDVEILTTTVKEFASDWNIEYYKEGMSTNAVGIPVRRFRIRKRDVKAFDVVNSKLIRGAAVNRAEEDIFNQEMVNSPQLYEYIEKHYEEYQCFVFIPYMFGTTYYGVQACYRKAVLIPCFHDEGYAHFKSFAQVYSKVAGMLFNAQPEFDLTESLMDISKVKTEVMGLGVDTDITYDADRFRAKYGVTEPFILYAGRKDTGKNVDTLLADFAEYKRKAALYRNAYGVKLEDYRAEYGEDARIQLVEDADFMDSINIDGRYNPENIQGIEVAVAQQDENYYRFYKTYHNAGNLKLVLIGGGEIAIPEVVREDVYDLGFVDLQDKFDAYGAAQILCQPSKNESFSFVIMESWLCGRPVLVHNGCDVTKHFVKDSNGGLYFDNYYEFQETVNYMLEHPEVADTMGSNGRAYVMKHFAWDVIVDKYKKFFEAL